MRYQYRYSTGPTLGQYWQKKSVRKQKFNYNFVYAMYICILYVSVHVIFFMYCFFTHYAYMHFILIKAILRDLHLQSLLTRCLTLDLGLRWHSSRHSSCWLCVRNGLRRQRTTSIIFYPELFVLFHIFLLLHLKNKRSKIMKKFYQIKLCNIFWFSTKPC